MFGRVGEGVIVSRILFVSYLFKDLLVSLAGSVFSLFLLHDFFGFVVVGNWSICSCCFPCCPYLRGPRVMERLLPRMKMSLLYLFLLFFKCSSIL